MKKVGRLLFVYLLIIGMIFSVRSIDLVAAGTGALSVSTSATTLHPGDEVTVNITADTNPGIITLELAGTYDTNVFTLKSKSVGAVLPDFASPSVADDTAGSVSFLLGNISASSNYTTSGTVCSFVLEVKGSAANGSTDIGITFNNAGNTDMEDVAFTVGTKTVSITGGTCLHTNLSHTDAVAVTCEADGNIEYWTCEDCNLKFSDSGATVVVLDSDIVITSTGHAWDAGIETTAPTCTAAGVKTYTCGTCGDTKTESISALGHSWDAGIETTAPTCTAAGVKTYTCGTCGDTKTETIAALGHSWDNGTITSNATGDSQGTMTFECANCAETKEEHFNVVYSAPEIDNSDGAVSAADKAKLKAKIPSGFGLEDAKYMDISMDVSFDKGGTFVPLVEDIAPAGGAELTIPYPAGTNANEYDFLVLHLLADDSVENLTPQKTNAGLKIKVRSCSPFAVIFKKLAVIAPLTPTPDATPTSEASPETNTEDALKSANTTLIMSPKTGENGKKIPLIPIVSGLALTTISLILIRKRK